VPHQSNELEQLPQFGAAADSLEVGLDRARHVGVPFEIEDASGRMDSGEESVGEAADSTQR